MTARLIQQEFIDRCNQIHKNKYNYTKTLYLGLKKNITIICPVHGTFEQESGSHLVGRGCPTCSGVARLTTESFIRKANLIHKNKYDYSATVVINSTSKVKIICTDHGEFLQRVGDHLNKASGCPACGNVKRLDTKEFVRRSSLKHNNLYTYETTKYINNHSKVAIICVVHGEFYQTASSHLSGKGCAKCNNKEKTTSEFVDQAESVHGKKYRYTNAKYHLTDTKISITCLKHGDFLQTPHDHVGSKAGCPKCAISQSKGETEVFNFIQSLGFNPEERNRKIITPKELDIVIPEKRIAIEYNGLRFHSDLFENARSRHKQKSTQCQAAGYKLIHIYEDDWLTRPEVVKKTLKHILGVSDERLYARKLTVQVLPAKATKPFYAANHMQDSGRGDSWCLMNDDQIVAAMQFGISSSERGNKDNSRYELIRFATSCQVVGGASKIFKAFLKDNPDVQTIISYSDNDMFTGKMYEVLGFVNAGQTPPDYKVILNNQRVHKANFKKLSIKKNYPEVYDETLTEKEMCHKLGFYRIYNTGLTKWIWTK